MSKPNEPQHLGVMIPIEETHPDHREHAKQPKHVDDDELARRTEHEREIVSDSE